MAHPLLTLKPSDILLFTEEAPTKDGLETHIEVVNITNSPVAFKVQTTNPKRYACKPCVGIISEKSTAKISVKLSYVQDPANPSKMILPEPEEKIRDKFQLLSTPFVEKERRPNTQELNEMLTKSRETVLAQRLLTRVCIQADGQSKTNVKSLSSPNNNNYNKPSNGNNGHINRSADSGSKLSNYADDSSDLDPDQPSDRPDNDKDEISRLRSEVARVNRLYQNSLKQQRKLSLVLNFILAVMVILFSILMYGTFVLSPLGNSDSTTSAGSQALPSSSIVSETNQSI